MYDIKLRRALRSGVLLSLRVYAAEATPLWSRILLPRRVKCAHAMCGWEVRQRSYTVHFRLLRCLPRKTLLPTRINERNSKCMPTRKLLYCWSRSRHTVRTWTIRQHDATRGFELHWRMLDGLFLSKWFIFSDAAPVRGRELLSGRRRVTNRVRSRSVWWDAVCGHGGLYWFMRRRAVRWPRGDGCVVFWGVRRWILL